MSHFVVLVRIARNMALHNSDVVSVIASMLAPYRENNMGDCPKEFLEFVDEEDAYRKQYETESVEMIELASGDRVLPWDEQFRVPGSFGFGNKTHMPPEHLKRVNVPYKDRYPTFEEYVAEWHDHTARDEEKGRFGYWENPRAKWDWYVIGGRWSGYFPIKAGCDIRLGRPGTFDNAAKPGHGDVAVFDEIDFDKIAEETTNRAEAFWEWWQAATGQREALVPSNNSGPFDRHRSKAIDLGLLDIRRGPLEERDAGKFSRPWAWSSAEERRQWHDVFEPLTKWKLMNEYLECFNPIEPYAYLDETGWYAPGRMGMFGCSDETPEAAVTHAKAFVEWLRSSPRESILVAVDCHT